VNEVTRKNAQSFLEDMHIQKIASAYEKYENIPDFAKVVTIKDIEDNNFSLSIPLYINTSDHDTEVDERSLQELYESWRTHSEMMKLRYTKLNSMISEGGNDIE
ncbi:MAG: N-6 DNA methylase, partial [Clostridiales bacterium]|nr:N-6 DNA methylase [Clostridiales bacterium]